MGLLVFYTAPDANGDLFSHRAPSLLSDHAPHRDGGHCTEGVDTGRIYFQQACAELRPERINGGAATRRRDTRTPAVYATTFHRADNYGFHDFEGFPRTTDVGVVVLDAPYTTHPEPVRDPADGRCRGRVRGRDSQAGRALHSSGYGLSRRSRCRCPSGRG